jgi:hypothetical protein
VYLSDIGIAAVTAAVVYVHCLVQTGPRSWPGTVLSVCSSSMPGWSCSCCFYRVDVSPCLLSLAPGHRVDYLGHTGIRPVGSMKKECLLRSSGGGGVLPETCCRRRMWKESMMMATAAR